DRPALIRSVAGETRAAIRSKIFEERILEVEDTIRREGAQLTERIARRDEIAGVIRVRRSATQGQNCDDTGRDKDRQRGETSTQHHSPFDGIPRHNSPWHTDELFNAHDMFLTSAPHLYGPTPWELLPPGTTGILCSVKVDAAVDQLLG